MPDDDDAFSLTVEVTRGTSTDDRDKFKAKVSAPTVGKLHERVEELRAKMEEWAEDFRTLQPTEGKTVTDDQSTLGRAES